MRGHRLPARLVFGVLLCAVPPPAAADTPAQTREPRPSVRALRASETIRVDGRLDEQAWQGAPSQGGFRQRQPFVGAPVSEETEFRVLYDDGNLYFAVVCRDREPEKIAARTLSHDSNRVFKDDLVSVNLDPQRDFRTVYGFTVNAEGTLLDGKGINNGEIYLSTWNTVWEARTSRSAEGWVAEIRIPFASIEADPGSTPVLGLQVVRQINRRNELADWAFLPPPFGSFHASEFGALEGIDIPPRSWRTLRLTPYLLGGFRQNPGGTDNLLPAGDTDPEINGGVDLKYPLTRSAAAQVTVRTDFSQVDIDDVQINLNRFNLFDPEKRPFFLDGNQFFEFGTPEFAQLFFSRRIGLEGNRIVPIVAGGRSYGKVGRTEYGALNIQTEAIDSLPDRNFSAVRIKRDVLSRSDIGLMAVHRQDTSDPVGANTAGGVDGTFRSEDGRLTGQVWVGGTRADPNVSGETEGRSGAAYLRTVWTPGLWEVRQSNILVGDAFDPGVGYMERTAIFRPTLTVRRSFLFPDRGIKELKFSSLNNVYTNDELDRFLDWSTQWAAQVTTNAGFVGYADVTRQSDKVLTPFDLKTGVTVPPARYSETTGTISLATPSVAALSASLEYTGGGYFGGQLHQWVPALTVKPSAHLYLSAKAVVNCIDVPAAAYFATALNFAGNLAVTSRRSVDANANWNQNSDLLNLQYRIRWHFAPLSDVYLLYNEERTASGFATQFRALLVKLVYHFEV